MVSHDTFRCGDDSIAEAVANARKLGHVNIVTETRRRNALEALDSGFALRVTEEDLEDALLTVIDDDELLNETFFLQHTCNITLQIAGRNVHHGELCRRGIADTGEHIGDRICHCHEYTLLTKTTL